VKVLYTPQGGTEESVSLPFITGVKALFFP